MTKAEMIMMLEQFNDEDEVVVIGFDSEVSDFTRFAPQKQVEDYKKSERMVKNLVKRREGIINSKSYRNEENRKKRVQEIDKKIYFWDSRRFELMY